MEGFNHLSVMADEVVDNLITDRSGVYVDCTLGGGGHSLKISQQLNDNALIIGIDQDIEAINAAKIRLNDVKCQVKIIHNNFSQINEILDECNIDKVDGILFDLGVSSHQIDTAERGFSYMQNAPLDMRMDTSKNFTAYNVVNEYAEENLYKIFHEYGEERFSNRIVKAIVNARKIKPIETTGELVKIIENVVPFNKKSGHPAKRIFQAIRIEVNNELEILNEAINSAVDHLKIGGRIAVITFHSLEDRIIKNTFKTLATDCICPKNFPVCVCNHKATIKILGKVATATEEEIKKNSRAKSAKIRIAEKINDTAKIL
ncbi:MAG: 16S rRNA (cytosine(1402)-N(4))-methyltransferase RsmH [Selenomonadaceae bacterium]|nr:16S rRNA (cytosine(1402)-N(4))-methyltransferase RsmH [Selenomonadaceae bacterium]